MPRPRHVVAQHAVPTPLDCRVEPDNDIDEESRCVIQLFTFRAFCCITVQMFYIPLMC